MQEEQIELLKEGDDNKLLVEIYMSELARVRYLLRAYLRARLQKIERHVMHVLDNAGGWWSTACCVRVDESKSPFGVHQGGAPPSLPSIPPLPGHAPSACPAALLPRRHGGAAIGQGVAVCARLLCAVWQPHEGGGGQPPPRRVGRAALLAQLAPAAAGDGSAAGAHAMPVAQMLLAGAALYCVLSPAYGRLPTVLSSHRPPGCRGV